MASKLLPTIAHSDINHSESGVEAHFELQIPAELSHFDGHFPGTPILPGVTQIDWAIKFASSISAFGKFRQITKLKFSRPIFPDSEVHLKLVISADRTTASFAFTSGTEIHSQGRVHFDRP